MAKFESQERRMPKIEACLKANGLESLDACREMLLSKGIDVDAIVKGVQPICFENAVWAYTLGTAIAVKRGLKSAADCAAAIGEGLEAFTIPGSVAEQRAVGLGHGNLGAMLLRDETKCFAFLAGHELCRRRGRHRHRPHRQQGPQGAAARYPERPGQGRRLYHQPHQRLHLCGDGLRLQDRRAEGRAREGFFRRRTRRGEVLRRQRRARGRCHYEEGGR